MPIRKAPTPIAAWRQSILAYVARHPDHPLKPRALARELRIPSSDYTTFRSLVRDLLENGTLVLGPGRTLCAPDQTGQIVGTFHTQARYVGRIERPGQPALFVPRRRTADAMDGDTVVARLLKPRGRHLGLRAEVVRIVARAPRRWVGTLERAGLAWIVRPHGRHPLPAVRITVPTACGSQPGDLVVVEPAEGSVGGRQVEGAIIERLGDPDDARARVRGVLRRFGIPDRFPPHVERAARGAAERYDASRNDGREDLRDLLTITIDPPDARDFDDAISVEALADGKFLLGVHIADVAHFVTPGGPVDQEARRRGTSIYFPSLVVPMIPEVLSNRVCSLQPGEPRLTKSAFLTYDRQGHVIDTRLANSVINSGASLTYQQVTRALQGRAADLEPEVLSLLTNARTLAQHIQRRRIDNGMVVLTLPELDVRLDDGGRVADAGPAETSFSNTMIEMFMVEANEAVSRRLTRAGLCHLRRVHPPPEPVVPENLAQLRPLVGRKTPTSLTRASIRGLLDAVRGKPAEAAVNYVLLRSLAPACYSPEEAGHFALASEDYCHFTSPIRRYPDLTVHRLLDLLLTSDMPPKGKRRPKTVLSDIDWAELGRETSAAERRAQTIEREAKTELLMLLMKSKIGETFAGVVTGVASYGVFIQIMPYLAEGLLRVEDLGADDWQFDRKNWVLIGRPSQRVVHVGQPLRVRVVGADPARQRLDLVPGPGQIVGRTGCGSPLGNRRQGGRRGSRKSQ